jgi:hypothetical protein
LNRLTNRPTQPSPEDGQARFERFNLSENPFPANPIVNQHSTDKRINGSVYEGQIRTKEYNQIADCFLKSPQSDPNHLRLGYIMDTSYIGRGNGKSAFLVNLQQDINKDYCMDISEGVNKCFAVYLTPEPGGRTKTFLSLVDLVFDSICDGGIIQTCLAILRLDAIRELGFENRISPAATEQEIIANLGSAEWYKNQSIDYSQIAHHMRSNAHLQKLSPDFPLLAEGNSLLSEPTGSSEYARHYYECLHKGKERLDFVFTHLVRLFQAAGFNGAYVLVDDFERVPSFQSARQKTDFALELRSCLFDGLTSNARIGFYNFLLVLHAGVPRLIRDAWDQSGMSNRAPIEPPVAAKHVIPFEKLSRRHAVLLLHKYLAEYRITSTDTNDLSPFNAGAVGRIGALSEYNAAKMLKMAYELLEKAAASGEQAMIDEAFVDAAKVEASVDSEAGIRGIQETSTVDLVRKAKDAD